MEESDRDDNNYENGEEGDNVEIETLENEEEMEGLEGEDEDEVAYLNDELADEEGRDDSYQSFSCNDPVYCVDIFETNPVHIATGWGDNKVRIFVPSRSDPILTLEGHTDTVIAIEYNSDHTLLASASMDSTVRIYSLPQYHLVEVLEGAGDEIEWLCWNKKFKNILAYGSKDLSIWIWGCTATKCTLVQTLYGHGNDLSCGKFTENGKCLCSGSIDGTFRLWNPKSGESLFTFESGQLNWPQNEEVLCCDIKGNEIAAVGFSGGSISIINIESKHVLKTLAQKSDNENGQSIECVKFCGVMNWLASGSMDFSIIIWDLDNYSIRHIVRHLDGITQLMWMKNSAKLFSASVDNTIGLWDARSGQKIKDIEGHSNVVLCLAYTESTDPPLLVSGGDDCNLLFYLIDK